MSKKLLKPTPNSHKLFFPSSNAQKMQSIEECLFQHFQPKKYLMALKPPQLRVFRKKLSPARIPRDLFPLEKR